MKKLMLFGTIIFSENSATIQAITGVILINEKDAEEIGDDTGMDYIIPSKYPGLIYWEC